MNCVEKLYALNCVPANREQRQRVDTHADHNTVINTSTMSSQQSPAALQSTVDREKVYTWIIELSNPETRENALLELSKKREVVPDLAPMLWHSFGTTASLLQEIINIYPAINPATLTAYQSNRVCNALALLQCVASHPETRSAFLQVKLHDESRIKI